MSFMNTSNDFADFVRFFYDQVSLRNDFFEKHNPKIVWIFGQKLILLTLCALLCKTNVTALRKTVEPLILPLGRSPLLLVGVQKS